MTARRKPRKSARPRPAPPPARARPRTARAPRFVGRDPSPVLDRYPPKDPNLAVRGPPAAAPALPPVAAARSAKAPVPPLPSTAAPPNGTPPTAEPRPPQGLISLERPFDPDEFASLLGQTTIRVNVPREHLAEVLRRISDFMGFGIYVYAIRVAPAPEELLKRFVVELERVDFSPSKADWVRFEEKGRSESPFGPTGDRR